MEMVCLILTLLNFIMILQILPAAISEQQSSSAGIITDAGGSQILYSNFVAYCGSMLNVSCLLSKYTKDGEECQLQCLDTPECLSVNILKALSKVMASFSSVSC